MPPRSIVVSSPGAAMRPSASAAEHGQQAQQRMGEHRLMRARPSARRRGRGRSGAARSAVAAVERCGQHRRRNRRRTSARRRATARRRRTAATAAPPRRRRRHAGCGRARRRELLHPGVEDQRLRRVASPCRAVPAVAAAPARACGRPPVGPAPRAAAAAASRASRLDDVGLHARRNRPGACLSVAGPATARMRRARQSPNQSRPRKTGKSGGAMRSLALTSRPLAGATTCGSARRRPSRSSRACRPRRAPARRRRRRGGSARGR